MSTVSATGSSSDIFDQLGLSKRQSSSAAAGSIEESQNRFLTMLTTQLKNQDPLNPMDNSQMTSQLAQMSTVSGIEKLNSTLNALVSSLSDAQAMQSADMIGKSVLVSGSKLAWANGAAFAGANLASAADEVKVSIVNSAGAVVQTQSLGAHEAGSFTFSWDGLLGDGSAAPEGVYSFKLDATQGGKSVVAEPLQVGTVFALVRSANGFLLDLGDLGTVDFKNVKQIL